CELERHPVSISRRVSGAVPATRGGCMARNILRAVFPAAARARSSGAVRGVLVVALQRHRGDVVLARAERKRSGALVASLLGPAPARGDVPWRGQAITRPFDREALRCVDFPPADRVSLTGAGGASCEFGSPSPSKKHGAIVLKREKSCTVLRVAN